jgi:hypothetical protein
MPACGLFCANAIILPALFLLCFVVFGYVVRGRNKPTLILCMWRPAALCPTTPNENYETKLQCNTEPAQWRMHFVGAVWPFPHFVRGLRNKVVKIFSKLSIDILNPSVKPISIIFSRRASDSL